MESFMPSEEVMKEFEDWFEENQFDTSLFYLMRSAWLEATKRAEEKNQ